MLKYKSTCNITLMQQPAYACVGVGSYQLRKYWSDNILLPYQWKHTILYAVLMICHRMVLIVHLFQVMPLVGQHHSHLSTGSRFNCINPLINHLSTGFSLYFPLGWGYLHQAG